MDTTQQSRYAAKVMKRYNDAYLVARATSGIGGTIKVLGWVFGGIVALLGFANAKHGYGPPDPLFQFGGIVLGLVIALPLWVLGILIAAQGEILKADLDDAVNTSPFLDNDQRASVMSL
jgi:hypothetical protein